MKYKVPAGYWGNITDPYQSRAKNDGVGTDLSYKYTFQGHA